MHFFLRSTARDAPSLCMLPLESNCSTPIQPLFTAMHINLSLTPLVSLIAGVLILVAPKLLNYIVAFYLIAIGVIGLFGLGALHLR